MDRIPLETKPRDGEPQIRPYANIVQDAIQATKQAEELKEIAIKELLSFRDQIDRDLKSLGYEQPSSAPIQNGTPLETVSQSTSNAGELKRAAGLKPFRNLDLASVGKIILQEHGGGPVHGKEIEKLARAGGYDKGGKHWQGYLSIALKRVGGVENVGMNRWKLNNQIAPVPIGRIQK